MWAEIVGYFAAFAGIGTFLYFIIKLAIEKFMEAGLERYRSALRVDLETHKAELSRITQEHRIRFEHLHPERFSTIKNLHDQICVLEDSLSEFTTKYQDIDGTEKYKQRDALIEEHKKFEKLIRATRLYLDPSLSEKLEGLQKSCWDIILQMNRAVELDISNQGNSTGPDLDEREKFSLNNWIEADKKVKEDFKEARTEIEREFRKLLSGI